MRLPVILAYISLLQSDPISIVLIITRGMGFIFEIVYHFPHELCIYCTVWPPGGKYQVQSP